MTRSTTITATTRVSAPIAVAWTLALALMLPGCHSGLSSQTTSLSPPIGIDLPKARVPLEGLLTGGQPTNDHLERAAGAGYRTVINLRSSAEDGFVDQSDLARRLGMRYVHIPIASRDDLNEQTVRRIAETLAASAGEPAILHCASGNRVGAALALRAHWLDGASPDQALELGRRAGLTRLEEAVIELLGVTAD